MTKEEIEALLELEENYGSDIIIGDVPAIARTALDALVEVERLKKARLAFQLINAQVEDEGEFTERSWEQLRAALFDKGAGE